MKKIAIYGLMALMSASFVACDNYEEPNPDGQINAQESILKTDDVAVASVLTTDTYDLAAFNAEAKIVEIATVTTSALPDTYSLVSHVEISRQGDFKWVEVASEVTRDEADPTLYHVTVTPDALQGVYFDNISKAPSEKTLDVRLSLATKITVNTMAQEAFVGGPGYYYGPYTMTVKPIPSDIVVEDAYYLIGTACDWNVADAIAFSHSGGNPYDNPVFTLYYTITQEMADAGWWWKIIPASTKAAGNWLDADYSQWGPAENGDENLEGMLSAKKNGVDPGAGCIKKPGQYLLTINVLEGTYAFTEAIPYFWTPGGSNGWNHAKAQLLYTDNYSDYMGFVNIQDEFKFTSVAGWDGLYNLGAGAEAGKLVNGSNDNIKVSENGLYWVTMSLPNLTYALAPIKTLGLIGDATPGGWDASTALTPSADFLTWTGTVTMKGGEYKIRANDAWDIDFGGEAMNLSYKGANIATPGEGTYNVTLKLNTIPYQITFTKK